MQTYRCEGIILQTHNYNDYDQIITIFSDEYGLVKLAGKKANAAKRGLRSSTLVRGEFVFIKNSHELYPLREVSILNQYLAIRQNLNSLNAACECMKAILQTQLLHKPAPELYKLLAAYLEKIPQCRDPKILEASFRLKLLRHEGILQLEGPFSDEELVIMDQLAHSRSFFQLNELPMSDEFNSKIKSFFHRSLQN